ncbi:MAG TPA: hypothetical protein VK213_07750 [Bacteroidales bacterium]|nr:hypothetical protein [Bacteroidales bacterium]
MKRSAFIVFSSVILTLMFSNCGNSGTRESSDATVEEPATAAASDLPAIHKYGIKSGIVTYENTGFGLTTKSILYFDEWGTKEAEEKYDQDGNLTETSLCDGKNMYLLIHKDKTAYSRGECWRGVAYKFDWEEAQKSGTEYKPTKLANLNIAGKDCESFSLEISGSKTVYAGWNNISFMIETPAGNSTVINKAVSIEENVPVPGDKLAVPADYKAATM